MKSKKNETKAPVVEAVEQQIEILTKASTRVYTVGGNDVYTLLKHARAYVRKMAGISGRRSGKKSAEDLNQGLASILSEA